MAPEEEGEAGEGDQQEEGEPELQPEHPQQPRSADHFLFTRRGKKMEGRQIPTTFTKIMSREASLPILFSDYRDAILALFRAGRHTSENLDDLAALQAGHSKKTDAKVYGRAGEENLAHDADFEWDMLQVTQSLHTLIFKRCAPLPTPPPPPPISSTFSTLFFTFLSHVFLCLPTAGRLHPTVHGTMRPSPLTARASSDRPNS